MAYDNRENIIKLGNTILKWNELNQLTECDDNTFAYDITGKRLTKNNTTCFYDGNRFLREKNGNNEIIYQYVMEKVIGFTYNGHRYIYQRNIQGDIIRIYDVETDEVVAEYSYDAWRNQNVKNKNEDSIGDINPIRYRGYYYDKETGLYYLNARYYDPKLGRFISPDTLSILDDTMGEINGLNLYMYCKDNPVNYCDPSGCFPLLTLGIILIVGSFAVGFGTSVVSQGIQYGWNKINYWQCTVDGLFTALSTGLSFTGIGMAASIGLGMAMGFGQYAADSAFHNESLSLSGSLTSIVLGGIGGWISGAGARNIRNIANSMKLTGSGKTAVSAITNAANSRASGLISQKGMQATLNLYGKTAFNAVQGAASQTIRNLMIEGGLKIMRWTIRSALINLGTSYLYDYLGW